MKTVEELLKPRYKVTGPFPHMNCKVGDIIDFSDGYSSKQLTKTPYDDQWGETLYSTHGFDEAEIKEYPNLFQPLPWWSDRDFKIVEAVKFIKNTKSGEIYEVVEYSALFGYMSGHRDCFRPRTGVSNPMNAYINLSSHHQPATIAEYNEWKQSNK